MSAQGHIESARSLYTRAVEVLPNSDLLMLAFARFEERNNNVPVRAATAHGMCGRSNGDGGVVRAYGHGHGSRGFMQRDGSGAGAVAGHEKQGGRFIRSRRICSCCRSAAAASGVNYT